MRIYESHWIYLLSIVGGMLCGVYFKDFGKSLQPYAQMYINLLQLSVIPIIVMTVTSGISNITSHPDNRSKIWRISSSLLLLLFLSSSLATLLGYLWSPGEGLSKNYEIASLVNNIGDGKLFKEILINEEISTSITPSLVKFFLSSIPNNIFSALSQGAVLQIIVFSIILGAALGYKYSQDGINRSKAIDTLFPIFTLINNGVLAFLPVGIFFLLSSQFSSFKLSTIIVLTKLILTLCVTMMLLIIIFVGIIWYCSKKRLSEVINALSYITLMAVSTRSSFACIPSCIEGMSKFFDKDTTGLVIPFGNTTCRYGSIVFYSIGTIFIADIFMAELSFYGYFTIVFCSVLASFAASGFVGIVALQLITVVLDPLGLPLGTILALFIAIDPIVDVFDSVANVYGNCAAAALAGRKTSKIPIDENITAVA